MIKLLISAVAFMLSAQVFAGEQPGPTCYEMDSAAEAIGKINGATFVGPSYRLPIQGSISERGTEFGYSYDAKYSKGEESPTVKMGTIEVTALVKKGEAKCRILTVKFNEEKRYTIQ